jgi:hypothetical protein
MIKEIFPTKIYHAPVKNFEAIQEEVSRAVNAANWDYYQESEGWGKSQKFATPDPFGGDIVSEYKMESFAREIMQAGQELFPDYTYTECANPKSWITRYDDGDYAHIHNHHPAYMSGAYFFKVPKDDKSFFFSNHRTFCPMTVSEGDLLMFPSELNHGVYKVQDETRIVLSFNLHF